MKFALALLLVAIASTHAQEIDIWDFLNGNVVTPLITDVATGAVNTLTALLISLLGSIGKRDLGFLQNLAGSLTTDLQGVFNTLLSTFQGVFNNIGSFTAAGRSRVQVTVARAVADAHEAVRGIFSDFFGSVIDSLQSIATTVVNMGLATLVNVVGKRGLADYFATLTGTVSGLLDSLSGAASTLTSQLVDAVSPHLQDLQTTLINTSLDAAQSLLNTLANISQSIGK